MSGIKVITIVGARPQFIKAAPVSRAIRLHNRRSEAAQINEILVHTGQHYDHNMSQVFFDQLEIRRPRYNLGIRSGTHGEMTGAMLRKIEAVLLREKPNLVLTYGDTNSTVAGALAAAKLAIPVAHVEAGLRSFNRLMPEEINRVLTDHLSSLLFCPTDTAVINLKKEGIAKGVFKVGDVMYDAFLFYKDISDKTSTILSDHELKPGEYCLGTVHRQENSDDSRRLASIFTAFMELARGDLPFIVPLHPRTRKSLREMKIKDHLGPHVRLIDPVGYLEMISLVSHAQVILTDSGGLQKEAFFARVPCVTLRDETEWVETVASGWNHLGGAETETIMEAFQRGVTASSRKEADLYGGGKASELLLQHLV